MNPVISQSPPGHGRQVKGRAPARPSIQTTRSSSRTLHGNNGRLRTRRVDQTEIVRKKANRPCVRCGTNTHFVAECPYLPPRRPETEIKNTVFNASSPLENVNNATVPDVEQENELLWSEGEQYVEEILCARTIKRGRGNRRVVLIKWKDFAEPAWELLEKLEETIALDRFEEKYGSAIFNDGPLKD
ncbi:hypothetical protein K3495_g7072 [Podosphaera aphanis]|nr:hypothetical protein K3495_g7072 [Podosphaera aphanis]